MEDDQGRITTEDDEGAMEYIIKEEDEFNLKNLANSTEYKEAQLVPIELDPEDENLCNRVVVVSEKIKFYSAAKAASHAGMAEQTTQTWAKRIRSKPDFNTYGKQTNKGRRAKKTTSRRTKVAYYEFIRREVIYNN